MAWRKVTEQDLTSALSREEIDGIRSSADFETEPVGLRIAETVAYVRGCIRSGGRTRLADDPTTLPESLIGPAMNKLRVELLTRFDVTVNETRQKLYEDAEKLFKEVMTGDYAPEGDDETPATAPAAATAPTFSRPNPPRLLD